MRVRFDLYVHFNEPQVDEASVVAREFAQNHLEEALKGISNSSLHEENHILTTTLYLDPTEILPIEAVYPDELPDDCAKQMMESIQGNYKDFELQRV